MHAPPRPKEKSRRMKSSRKTVDEIRVASPCSMFWDEMEGDERVRFCDACRLHVYNLSAMDVEEAAELISARTEGLCVRFYRRRDGTVLTQDCPVGLRAAVRRRLQWLRAAVAAGAGVLLAALTSRVPGTTRRNMDGVPVFNEATPHELVGALACPRPSKGAEPYADQSAGE
jgi:hypothetical protein